MDDDMRTHRLRIPKEMASGAIGMSLASACLNPLDVIKVRMQATGAQYTSASNCARESVRLCGGVVRGLIIPGLATTLLRDSLNGAFRVGLYKEVERSLFPPASQTPVILQKLITGTIVGATGAGVWSHADLIKTRIQLDSCNTPRFTSTLHCYQQLVREDGVRGLYRGVATNMFRASIVTTSHVGTYGAVKPFIEQYCSPGMLSWTIAGLASALVTSTASAPIDLIRTLVMQTDTPTRSSASILYHVKRVYLSEGLLGFFKGWSPSFLRLGPHFTVSWPLIELCRIHIFKLDSFYYRFLFRVFLCSVSCRNNMQNFLTEFSLTEIAVAISVIILVSLLLWRRLASRPGSRRPDLSLILGPCGAGKTALFYLLSDPSKKSISTVTSQSPNRVSLPDHAPSELVDFPGHPRLWRGVAPLLPRTGKIVYLIDSSVGGKTLKPVAENLFALLTSKELRDDTTVLLCRNKTDVKEGMTEEELVKTLNSELESIRKARTDDVFLGIDGEVFDLLRHSPVEIRTGSASVKQGRIDEIQQFLRN